LDKASNPQEKGVEIAVDLVKGFRALCQGLHLMVVGREKNFAILDRFSSSQEFSYQAHRTGEMFARLEPWERELALHQMAISVAYHLQIPEEAWAPHSRALEIKIQQLLERDGTLSYFLSIVGIKRQE
jgi:hypothetical protein